jgi:hypothetical protein
MQWAPLTKHKAVAGTDTRKELLSNLAMQYSPTFVVVIWLSVCTALGCSKSDKTAADKSPMTDKSTPPKPSADKKMTMAEALGSSKKASVIGPLAAAKFGMSEEELKAAVPLYAKKGDFITLQDDGIGTFPTLSGPAADQSATRTKKRLTAVVLTITDADVDQLKAAWGPATEITDSGTPTSVWLNAEDKIRAMMVPAPGQPGAKMLTIQPYLPSKWILGEPGKPLGIEDKRPLIGLSAAELQADYPDFCNKCSDESLSFMSWNPDEFGNLFKMELGMNAGKVESLQYWISFGANPTVKAAKKAEIEAKYGVAKEVKTDLGPKLVLSEKPKVTIAELEDSWVVGIAR